MAGRKVRNRMKLKAFVEIELQKLQSQLDVLQAPTKQQLFSNADYIRGKIDALKWVLTNESSD
jgi:hypothetical protein